MGFQERTVPAGKPSVATVEVTLAGQPVTNGSAVSAVGLLEVTTNRQATLYVDGIAWSPVSIAGDTASYIVSTGGRFMLYIDDRLVFTFVNEITPDFSLISDQRLYFYDDDGQQVGGIMYGNQTYVQAEAQPTAVKVRVRITGYYPATVWELEPSSNQGSATLDTEGSAHYVTVTDYDPGKHLEVYLGNVLLAFVTPVTE